MSFVKNNKYEILTPDGFKRFGGVSIKGKRQLYKINFNDGTHIDATIDHVFFVNGVPKKVCELKSGTALNCVGDNEKIISNIEDSVVGDVYDPVEVADGHIFIVNGVITTKNCDEFAFVPPNIAKEFWTAIRPTLACVAGDTLVLTDSGFKRIDSFHIDKSIGDYFEMKIPVWGKDGMEYTSHGYVSPESDTLIVETKKGFKVEVTLNHPLYILHENGGKMVKARDIETGKYLRIEHSMNVFGKRDDISDDMAYMLGGYIAEGCIDKKRQTVAIENTDDDFRDVYLRNTIIKPFVPVSTKPSRIRCYSKDMIILFEKYGIETSAKCDTKTVPFSIFESTKNVISNFLSGLYDGDGSVTPYRINLTSTSRRLIQEVQMLLLNYGIISNVTYNDTSKIMERERKSGRKLPNGKPLGVLRDSWALDIPRSQFKKFKESIGFRIKRKQQKLDEYISEYIQNDIKQFTVPTEYVEEMIRDIIQVCNVPLHHFRKCGIRIERVLKSISKNRNITVDWLVKFRDIVSEIIDITPYNNFFNEVIGDFIWDEIVSITPSTNKTYDFTCPLTHSFLQNCILGSNTGGKAIITSTPNNNDDQFAQIWRAAENTLDEFGNLNPSGLGSNGFYALKVPWSEHPDRDDAWAKEERATLGEDRFNREHNCRFISRDETLISGNVLENMWGIDPTYKEGEIRFYDEIKPNHAYLVGLDPSAGVGGDSAAIQIYQLPDFKQVGEWCSETTDIKGQVGILLKILHKIYKQLKNDDRQMSEPSLYWTFENNGGFGEAVLTVINDTGLELFPGEFIQEPRKGVGRRNRLMGLNTTHRNKLTACMRLKSLVESGRIGMYSHKLVKELKTFAAKGDSFAAKPGEHDDLISATLLIIRIMEIVQSWDEDFGEKLKETIDTTDMDVEPLPFTCLM